MAPRTRERRRLDLSVPQRRYAACVWVTKPDGKRTRKYVYGETHEKTHDKWLALHQKAKNGPMVTKALTLGDFAAYWLREIVQPNLSPGTYVTYEVITRLYLVPGLGKRRLDKVQISDVQTWLNGVRRQCQCCAQARTSAGSRTVSDAVRTASAART